MKKSIITVLVCVLSFTACMKQSRDFESYYVSIVGGNSSTMNSEAKSYANFVADDLISDSVVILEESFLLTDFAIKRLFKTNGKAIEEQGAVWTLKDSDKGFPGMKLSCLGNDVWTLEWSGDYKVGSSYYPTQFVITGKRGSKIGKDTGSHYNWEISIEGKRTEDLGYSCSFLSEKLEYTGDEHTSFDRWSAVKGELEMIIYQNSSVLETWLVIYRGEGKTSTLRRT